MSLETLIGGLTRDEQIVAMELLAKLAKEGHRNFAPLRLCVRHLQEHCLTETSSK